ncbi:peptide deformylase [Acinetobacter schindleri]|uniref:peptide deformylase n=1 Tax=Acinetobacter schindleri TaxID=108981 RepID=UPI002FDCECB5
MTVLTVARQGEAILGLVATAVADSEFGSEWLYQLNKAMMDTMLDRQGVGIAAPQVYISKRIIIVASRPNLRYPEAPYMEAVTMLNPEIISASATQVLGEEGCLSVPEQRGKVARAEEVEVRYFTLEGREIVQSFKGFPARIVQHEIDHLNGILFVEKLSET